MLDYALAEAKAKTLRNTLGDLLCDTLSEGNAETLTGKLINLQANALLETLAGMIADAQAGTPGGTLNDVHGKVLIDASACKRKGLNSRRQPGPCKCHVTGLHCA